MKHSFSLLLVIFLSLQVFSQSTNRKKFDFKGSFVDGNTNKPLKGLVMVDQYQHMPLGKKGEFYFKNIQNLRILENDTLAIYLRRPPFIINLKFTVDKEVIDQKQDIILDKIKLQFPKPNGKNTKKVMQMYIGHIKMG